MSMEKRILFKRSAAAGKMPGVNDLMIGEIAINLADQKFYTKRLDSQGNEEIAELGGAAASGVQSTIYDLYTYTADGGETEVSVDHIVGYATVVLNGIELAPSDYTDDDPTVIKFNDSLNNGDEVVVYIWKKVGGAGGGLNTVNIDSDSNVYTNKLYIVDTSSAALTVTLPSSPAAGEMLWIADGNNNAQNNNVTVARNGNKINDDDDDLTCDVNGFFIGLVYNANGSWYVTNANSN